MRAGSSEYSKDNDMWPENDDPTISAVVHTRVTSFIARLGGPLIGLHHSFRLFIPHVAGEWLLPTN